jgi:sugar O-acyltransferase (sialic acid O-acetyltransferase NeuD family)
MSSALIIVGVGGHAVSVANVAISAGYSVLSFVDNNKVGQQLIGFPIISEKVSKSGSSEYDYVIAIGDNSKRKRIYEEFISDLPNANFPSLIHQSAVIGINSQIEEGSVIMPNSNIGPNSKVGKCCIINTRSSIDHDCILSDFVSLAPGVITGGNVKVGELSAISIGAVCKDGIKIGNDSVIGASSYVNKDVGNSVVSYGNPCKKIRGRVHGEPYLA